MLVVSCTLQFFVIVCLWVFMFYASISVFVAFLCFLCLFECCACLCLLNYSVKPISACFLIDRTDFGQVCLC